MIFWREKVFVAMAACDAQAGTGSDDAGPRNVAGVDGVAQRDVRITAVCFILISPERIVRVVICD
jgi:hypothetical protein